MHNFVTECANLTDAGLSLSAMLMKTIPSVGSSFPVAANALAIAWPKVFAVPITSPVLRISGPRSVSAPGNLAKGNTTAFTKVSGGSTSSLIPNSSRLFPAMTRAPILAH